MNKIHESKQIYFNEIDFRLSADAKPSAYINEISNGNLFKEFPFNMLHRLKETKQPLKYHPEGSVWNHTMMVVDKAAYLREFSHNKREFMWAAFLHDIGKPSTTKIKKGRITSYGHDEAGTALTRLFLKEFLSEEIFIKNVAALVRWHMQVLYAVKNLPFLNIEAIKRETNLNDLVLLSLCDKLGRTGADENNVLKDIRIFLETLNYNKAI